MSGEEEMDDETFFDSHAYNGPHDDNTAQGHQKEECTVEADLTPVPDHEIDREIPPPRGRRPRPYDIHSNDEPHAAPRVENGARGAESSDDETLIIEKAGNLKGSDLFEFNL